MGMRKQSLVGAACLLACLAWTRTHGDPGYGEPLTLTTGTVYRVGTAAALVSALDAINDAGVPATVLISNGVYVLDTWALPVTCDNVIIRSLGGDRDAVVLRGPDEGEEASLEHVFWVTASDVTIADLTFGWCRYHGVQAQGQEPYNVDGLLVHNCRIVNCNEQFIKGTSSAEDPEGVTGGTVESCLFEFTSGWAYQYYTGGLDIHKGADWVVRDNLFRNLRDVSGVAEHAIHFWNRNTVRPQNVIVERNIIINCDRGIGLGLSSWAGGFEGGNSAIRNNSIWNDGTGPNTDVGIGLEYACQVQVDNNTVYVPYWAPIEYRFSGSSNLVFRNNLVNGPITERDGAPVPVLSSNITAAQAGWFRSLTNGDLRLILPGSTNASAKGVFIADFNSDLYRQPRPATSPWSVGAHEYDAATTDADGDRMMDDAEWRAGTDLRDPASFLGFAAPQFEAESDAPVLRWKSVDGKRYTLSRATNLVAVAWAPIATNLPGSAPLNSHTDTAACASSACFYRVELE